MARSIRGWIRNLTDGLGPVANTVNVEARVEADGAEINNTTHGTGSLTFTHVQDGSGNVNKAAANGHFGYDMELNPGKLDITVNPTDPSVEYRKRFPDEASQIGKAFMSDIERFGWLGGPDALVWNGIHGGHEPANPTEWSWDPTLGAAWGVGNWSIDSFSGMSVVMRRGIGFVGGALFSIEQANTLTVPVAGFDPLPDNALGSSDRWDVLFAVINIDPSDDEYGKQTFEFLQGQPGQGLPAHPGQTAGFRKLALFGLKVPAAGSAYTTAYDLRRWLYHPAQVPIMRQYAISQPAGLQLVSSTSDVDSVLNASIVTEGDIILPLGSSWSGVANLTIMASAPSEDTGTDTRLRIKMISEGRGLKDDTAISGTDFMDNPPAAYDSVLAHSMSFSNPDTSNDSPAYTATFSFPIRVIPAYHRDSQVNTSTRNWHKLRLRVRFNRTAAGNTPIRIQRQYLSVMLWPGR